MIQLNGTYVELVVVIVLVRVCDCVCLLGVCVCQIERVNNWLKVVKVSLSEL